MDETKVQMGVGEHPYFTYGVDSVRGRLGFNENSMRRGFAAFDLTPDACACFRIRRDAETLVSSG
jgi:hypothetical protein